MTPEEYQDALDRLDISQVGAARLFRVNERTSRRWASGDQEVPRAVEIALILMVRFRVEPSLFLNEDADASPTAREE